MSDESDGATSVFVSIAHTREHKQEHAHTHAHAHAYTHAHTHTHAHAHVHAHTHAHAHTHTHTHAHAHVHAHAHAHAHAQNCVSSSEGSVLQQGAPAGETADADTTSRCAFFLADSSYACHCAFRSCMLELVGHFRRCGNCSFVAVCSDAAGDGAAPCLVNHWLEHRDECTSLGASQSRAVDTGSGAAPEAERLTSCDECTRHLTGCEKLPDAVSGGCSLGSPPPPDCDCGVSGASSRALRYARANLAKCACAANCAGCSSSCSGNAAGAASKGRSGLSDAAAAEQAEIDAWGTRPVQEIREAAALGNAAAQVVLGTISARSGDFVHSFRLWSLAAASAHLSTAQHNLGACFFEGKGTARDFSKAVECYRAAADQGNAGALRALALCYRDGCGVPADRSAAFALIQRAAELGDLGACAMLARCLMFGDGTAVDFFGAMRWARVAADRGNGLALNIIGMLYGNGEGVDANAAEAVQYFLRAFKAGNDDAIANMRGLAARGCPEAKEALKRLVFD